MIWSFDHINRIGRHVKLLFNRLGFMDVWYSHRAGDIKKFLRVFKIRIRDVYVQDWHAILENSSRVRFCTTI